MAEEGISDAMRDSDHRRESHCDIGIQLLARLARTQNVGMFALVRVTDLFVSQAELPRVQSQFSINRYIKRCLYGQ